MPHTEQPALNEEPILSLGSHWECVGWVGGPRKATILSWLGEFYHQDPLIAFVVGLGPWLGFNVRGFERLVFA